MALLVLSACLNVLFLIVWLLQSCSSYSLRGEHTYIILTTLMVVSSLVSFSLIFLKRRIFNLQLVSIFHLPSILIIAYFLLSLLFNPVSLVVSLLFNTPESEIRYLSPTGQATIVFREDCDFSECAHATMVYLNSGIFHTSLELHENNQYLCKIDNAGFEKLKARQANLKWSSNGKQIEWKIQNDKCVITF